MGNLSSISKEELVQDLKSLGLEFKGGSKDGRFMEFVDKKANVRVKSRPPDKVGTDYNHIHLYDKAGNPLNAQLEIVSYKSSEAHIKITDDVANQLIRRSQ